MHLIEPYYRWRNLYVASEDDASPFFGREYSEFEFQDRIYNYYIHPQWDSIGSPTLFVKILYVEYDTGYAVIELLGEWNDTIENDVMTLKRDLIDEMLPLGINKYLIIGENVLNFHASDDCYYEEWFDDVEDGWIVGINFPDFIVDEMSKFNLDSYIQFGKSLNIDNWRTVSPNRLVQLVDQLVVFRLGE